MQEQVGVSPDASTLHTPPFEHEKPSQAGPSQPPPGVAQTQSSLPAISTGTHSRPLPQVPSSVHSKPLPHVVGTHWWPAPGRNTHCRSGCGHVRKPGAPHTADGSTQPHAGSKSPPPGRSWHSSPAGHAPSHAMPLVLQGGASSGAHWHAFVEPSSIGQQRSPEGHVPPHTGAVPPHGCEG